MFALYLPLTPWSTDLGWPAWVMFGVWMLIGIWYMIRLPGGIRAGADAEEQLMAAVRRRRAQGGDSGLGGG
jgi:hypothetical protein